MIGDTRLSTQDFQQLLTQEANITDAENLKTLAERESGEILYVGSDNHLQKMGFFQRFSYRHSSTYRTQVQEKVKKVIDALTVKVKSDDETQKKRIQTLFFDKLSRLNRKVWGRSLSEKTFRQLLGSEDTIAKRAELWARLGNFSALGTGSSGSYKITQGKVVGENSLKEKTLGIFKPSSEEVLSAKNPKFMTRLKRLLHLTILRPISGSLFSTAAGQSYLAEVATKKVEEMVIDAVKDYVAKNPNLLAETKKLLEDIKLVPQTVVATLQLGQRKEEKGSFQEWVDDTNFKEAYKALGVRGDNYKQNGFLGNLMPLKDAKAVLPQELFDLLVIIDYITANSDRHGENWFIVYDKDPKEKDSKIIGIRLIDGGWSMSPDHPQHMLSPELTKQYIWKNLPHAGLEFSDAGKHVIEYLKEREESLGGTVHGLYKQNSPKEDQETDVKRIDRMKERLTVLDYFSKNGKTKSELAQIRTVAQISDVLRQVSPQTAVAA